LLKLAQVAARLTDEVSFYFTGLEFLADSEAFNAIDDIIITPRSQALDTGQLPEGIDVHYRLKPNQHCWRGDVIMSGDEVKRGNFACGGR
jgi:hypothetical protein